MNLLALIFVMVASEISFLLARARSFSQWKQRFSYFAVRVLLGFLMKFCPVLMTDAYGPGVTDIPRSTAVVPVIETNNRVTIGAELLNGQFLIGQSHISHPLGIALYLLSRHHPNPFVRTDSSGFANGASVVAKNAQPPMPSPIKR